MPPAYRALIFALGVYSLAVVWRRLTSLLRNSFIKKMTVLNDLPASGIARPGTERIKGTAVICGGSVAGLLTARICADHFEDVLIIEAEAWLETEEGSRAVYDEKGVYIPCSRMNTRTRVSQYRATHAYQVLLHLGLRHLFPTFEQEIRRLDGRVSDAEFHLHVFGGQCLNPPKEEYPEGGCPKTFFMSRESFERLLRRLVRSYSDRIRWATGTVTGVKTSPHDRSILESVTYRSENEPEKSVSASLVLDCAGRSQVGFKWLKRIFTETKKDDSESGVIFGNLRDEYNTLQRYQIFRFYVPPEARERLTLPIAYEHATWLFAFMPKPGIERKYFTIDKLEGHRIQIGFTGWGDPVIPLEYNDIKDWLKNLGADEPVPEWIFSLVDVLLEYREMATAETTRYPNLTWIHYERSPYIPSNFVAVGDSVMIVNPTFGQGCTKACIGAIALDSMLRSPELCNMKSIPSGFGARFFRLHADKIASAWDGTKPTDYQWDTTTPVKGEKLSDARFFGGLTNIIMQLATMDKKVNSALWHVRGFLGPPTDLLSPSILAKAALFWLRRHSTMS